MDSHILIDCCIPLSHLNLSSYFGVHKPSCLTISQYRCLLIGISNKLCFVQSWTYLFLSQIFHHLHLWWPSSHLLGWVVPNNYNLHWSLLMTWFPPVLGSPSLCKSVCGSINSELQTCSLTAAWGFLSVPLSKFQPNLACPLILPFWIQLGEELACAGHGARYPWKEIYYTMVDVYKKYSPSSIYLTYQKKKNTQTKCLLNNRNLFLTFLKTQIKTVETWCLRTRFHIHAQHSP